MTMTQRDQTYSRPLPTTVEIATIQLCPRHYGWRVLSDCGVVKVYSSRDGCLTALAPAEARRIAEEFAAALNEAADCTEVRSYGEVVSR